MQIGPHARLDAYEVLNTDKTAKPNEFKKIIFNSDLAFRIEDPYGNVSKLGVGNEGFSECGEGIFDICQWGEGEYDASTTYLTDQIVWFVIDGKVYPFISLQDANTGNTPAIAGDAWWVLTDRIPQWTVTFLY